MFISHYNGHGIKLVRPLSTVDNTRDYARVSHSRQSLSSNYNIANDVVTYVLMMICGMFISVCEAMAALVAMANKASIPATRLLAHQWTAAIAAAVLLHVVCNRHCYSQQPS